MPLPKLNWIIKRDNVCDIYTYIYSCEQQLVFNVGNIGNINIGPHTQHIWDMIRCSVVFDTIEDLLNGCNKLKDIILNNNNEQSHGCILSIIRIKNGFHDLFGNNTTINAIKEMKLYSFDYCDIKLNVMIKIGEIKMIGELQLLLNWMLHAKKIGHSYYSFIRKQDLYYKIYNNININIDYDNDNNIINDKINSIILAKNLNQLSIYFENIINQHEKKYIATNKNQFIKQFNDTKWKKGLQLFNFVLNDWN